MSELKSAYKYTFLAVMLMVALGGLALALLYVIDPGKSGRQQLAAKAKKALNMKFVFLAYVQCQEEKGHTPKSAQDIAPYLIGTPPEIMEALQNGKLVVQWGAPCDIPTPEADGVVLAYWEDPVFDGEVCVMAQSGKSSLWSRAAFEAAPKAKPSR
jgi:hypothetical protein